MTRRHFTADEDKDIANPRNTLKELATKLHRTESVIRRRARSLGVSIPLKIKPYTTKEDAIIRRLISTKTTAHIAARLNRSRKSVSHRIHQIKSTLPITRNRKAFTKSEDQLIKNLAIPVITLATQLNRHTAAIHRRARDLGLPRRSQRHEHTAASDLQLLALYQNHTASEIAQVLNRSEASVKSRLNRLKKEAQ